MGLIKLLLKRLGWTLIIAAVLQIPFVIGVAAFGVPGGLLAVIITILFVLLKKEKYDPVKKLKRDHNIW